MIPEQSSSATCATPAVNSNDTPEAGFGWVIITLVIAGLVSWFLVVQPVLKAHATARWPSTTGTVIRSSFTKTQTVKPSITRFRPVVEYTYTIPATGYTRTSSQVSADGLIFTSKRDIDDFLASYRPGMNVPVSYNPNDHSDAVLVTGYAWHGSVNHWLMYFLGNCGVALVIAALAALCGAARRVLVAAGLCEDRSELSK